MSLHVSRNELIAQVLAPDTAAEVAEYLAALDSEMPAAELWQEIVRDVLEPAQPPAVHAFLHAAVFCDWAAAAGPAPAWFPSAESIAARIVDTAEVNGLSHRTATTYGSPNRAV